MPRFTLWQKALFVITYPLTLFLVKLPNAISRLIFSFRKNRFRLSRPNCLFLVNPSSGAKLGESILKIVKTLGRSEKIAINVFEDNFSEKVRSHIRSSLDPWHLIICGGDGTINLVIDKLEKCLSESERERVIYVPMALGTGNDMSRTLGFGPKVGLNHVSDFFKKLDSPSTTVKQMDRWKARVEQPGLAKPFAEVSWMLYLGIGYDAEVAWIFDRMRKKFTWLFENNVCSSDRQ